MTFSDVYEINVKDYLPGFRNKYFNKISLDSMLYFHNLLYMFGENAWLLINLQ